MTEIIFLNLGEWSTTRKVKTFIVGVNISSFEDIVATRSPLRLDLFGLALIMGPSPHLEEKICWYL